VLVSLPFVAVMIRGVRPYYRMTFVAMPLMLLFVAHDDWYQGSIDIGNGYIRQDTDSGLFAAIDFFFHQLFAILGNVCSDTCIS